ncbi:MAG TPA: hypothetical protein V6D11_04315 [Waterburya sp.]
MIESRMHSTAQEQWVHSKAAQVLLRRDKGDKEDRTEKEKYICLQWDAPSAIASPNSLLN